MLHILHTADWHLGQHFFGYDRSAEHEHFLNWLAEQIGTHAIDVLLIAGDVFDVSNPSASSQRMFYRFINKVTRENPHLQIIVVAGNHDSAARLEAPSPLLESIRVSVKGIIRKHENTVDWDDLILSLYNRQGEAEALCLAVPYLRQGDYPVIETTGNPYSEGVREFYKQLITRAVELRNPSQALIAMGHLQATGSEIAEKDYSERTIIGGLESVSPDVFDEHVSYVALGHIHKSQRVSGREHIRYAGSPLPMSFAEKNYHHGVVLVTVENGKLSSLDRIEYIPLVGMVSVPAVHAATPAEVKELLLALPEQDSSSEAPYLEVKVLLEEPEPMLRQELEEILADKNVRLTRIVTSFRQSEGTFSEDEIMTVGLQGMTPLDIVKSTFEKTYQTEMPDRLLDLFREAYLSLEIGNEEEGRL